MAQGNQPILVTGARGFIGRAVVKLLQRKGYGVLGLDRVPAPEDPRSRKNGETLRQAQGRLWGTPFPLGTPFDAQMVGDIGDREQLLPAFESGVVGGIIHLAAILPTAAQRDPELATRVNVQGSLNLLEMAREFGVRRFVFGSSLSIYGTWPADHTVSEADRAAPADVYGAAKLYVEQCGAAYRELYGLEFVSLRIGRVAGPGAQSTTSAWRSQIFECLGTGSPTAIEIRYAKWERILIVHVEDVAEMLVKLIESAQPRHSIYNGCCESVIVGELKSAVEALNPRIRVSLGGAEIAGNPRALDCSRFRDEFEFETVPIFEQLRRAAGATANG